MTVELVHILAPSTAKQHMGWPHLASFEPSRATEAAEQSESPWTTSRASASTTATPAARLSWRRVLSRAIESGVGSKTGRSPARRYTSRCVLSPSVSVSLPREVGANGDVEVPTQTLAAQAPKPTSSLTVTSPHKPRSLFENENRRWVQIP